MNSRRILLGLAGDVMIGRSVDRVIAQKGFTYPWGNLLDTLRSTDMTIVNLETTLTTSNKKVEKVFNFKAAPERIKTLEEANITAVSLANNHILDFEEQGMLETVHLLNAAGIRHAGAGQNEEEALFPAILQKEGFHVGLLSFTDNERRWKAGPHYSGINYINVAELKDRKRAITAVQQLRKNVHLLVVSLHWGPNMVEAPPRAFIDFAHQLVDEGADIIHGHSAHIFQGIDVYQHKVILYDTGDLIDDYVVNPVLRNDLSFFFLLEVGVQKIYHLQLLPVQISHYQVNKATDGAYTWSLRRMQELSRPFGTQITDQGEVLLP